MQLKKDGTYKGVEYFKKQDIMKTKSWFENTNLNRQPISTVNRIRSGHSLLKKHLFNKNIIDSPICDCGESGMSVNHIIWDCNLIPTADRIKFYSQLTKKNIQMDTDVQQLFLKEPLSVILIFVGFLNSQKQIKI